MNRPDITSFLQSAKRPKDNQPSDVIIDGKPLSPGQELPDLPPPGRVIVKPNALLIDDNVIIYFPLTKTIFAWIGDCLESWLEQEDDADTNDEARKQFLGILEALEKTLLSL